MQHASSIMCANSMWSLLQSTTSQSDSEAASAKDFMAEEEQSKATAKAAAKKAKKQKQKANKKSLLSSPSSVGPAAHDGSSPASSATAAAAGESASLGMTVSNGSPSLDMERLTVSSEADTESARFLEELFCCPLSKVRPSCLQYLSDAFVDL